MWKLAKSTVLAFIDDEALSRGAAIAFYTVTSIAPILLIVVAVAGLVFGREAAQGAITAQLGGLMGHQTADVLQSAVASAGEKSSGVLATIIGIATLVATASGVFGEMQSALNAIWKAKPEGTTVSRLIRARAASLGLVAALGFLLIVSLAVSAGLTAFRSQCDLEGEARGHDRVPLDPGPRRQPGAGGGPGVPADRLARGQRGTDGIQISMRSGRRSPRARPCPA